MAGAACGASYGDMPLLAAPCGSHGLLDLLH